MNQGHRTREPPLIFPVFPFPVPNARRRTYSLLLMYIMAVIAYGTHRENRVLGTKIFLGTGGLGLGEQRIARLVITFDHQETIKIAYPS